MTTDTKSQDKALGPLPHGVATVRFSNAGTVVYEYENANESWSPPYYEWPIAPRISLTGANHYMPSRGVEPQGFTRTAVADLVASGRPQPLSLGLWALWRSLFWPAEMPIYEGFRHDEVRRSCALPFSAPLTAEGQR